MIIIACNTPDSSPVHFDFQKKPAFHILNYVPTAKPLPLDYEAFLF